MLKARAAALVSALCFVLAACAEDEDAELPGPTPRELLFGVSLPQHLRLSPSGAWVSFSQAYNGVRNIWLKPADGQSPARPITTFPYPGVGPHVWHPSSDYLLFLKQTPDSDDVRPYAFDLAQQTVIPLLGGTAQQASFLAYSEAAPDTIFIQTNARRAGAIDIYRVDLKTGASLLVYEDKLGANGYFAGADLTPLIAQVPKSDGGFEWRARTEDGGWRLWGTVGAEDALTTRMEQISADGEDVFLASSVERNTTAYLRVPAQSRFGAGETQVLAAQSRYDFADATYGPLNQRPFLATFATPRPSFVPLNKQLVPLVFGMRASGSGALTIADTNADGTRWLIGHVAASQPVSWGVYDAQSASKIALFPEQDELMAQQAAVLPIAIKISRSETSTFDAFLSLPLGLALNLDGKAARTVPVAVVLRGAMVSQDRWRYDPVHQWLASRGVAVLSLNHKGSVGQGKDHLFQADGLTQAIVADVGHARDWLAERGLLEERLAIIGGGASTAAAKKAALSLSASCVSYINPVPAMQRALGTLPGQQSGLQKLLLDYYGEDSASTVAKAPVFIAAAGQSRRQDPQTVFDWAAGLEEQGAGLTLIAVDRAEEDFSQGMDGRAVMATMELFLADCLGFEAEALSSADFVGSSITLLEAPDSIVQTVRTARSIPDVSR